MKYRLFQLMLVGNYLLNNIPGLIKKFPDFYGGSLLRDGGSRVVKQNKIYRVLPYTQL